MAQQGRVGTNRRRVGCGLVALALLAGGCTGDGDDAADAPTTTAADAATTSTEIKGEGLPDVKENPTFTEGDCWWERPADLDPATTITCGTVEVPADRTDPDTELLTLAVARMHRDDSDPAAEPVVYLHGGPGGDALKGSPGGLPFLTVLAERDVITFDQRGAGLSTPSLNCPEKEEATLDALGAAAPWAEEFTANRAAVRACYARLQGQGIDLSDYDTPSSVADMETIRVAMGVDTWNVWGVSYGTRLGLDYARTHPEQVRSLLIDSVYAPNVGGVDRARGLPSGAIERLAAACAEQAACAAANGDVSAQLTAAVASLDAEPEAVEGTFTFDGEDVTRSFVLTGPDVQAGMFAALYDSELIPVLPGIIAGLADGDRSIIPTFIATGVPRLIDLTEGAFYSVECADSGSLIDPDEADAALEDPGPAALIALGSAEVFCPDWPVDPVDDTFHEPVVVDVPTLVIGGTLDPITPYEESKEQAERMPGARLMTVPGGGHGPGSDTDCTTSARDTFWQDPAAELPSCLGSLVVPPFG